MNEPSDRAAVPNPSSSGWSQTAVAFWALTVGVLTMMALSVVLALVTRLPQEFSGTVLAVFPPRTPADEVFEAIDQTEARIIRATLFSNAWIIENTDPDFVARIKAAGALGAWKPVSGVSFAVGGCGFGSMLSNDALALTNPSSVSNR